MSEINSLSAYDQHMLHESYFSKAWSKKTDRKRPPSEHDIAVWQRFRGYEKKKQEVREE